MFVSGNSTKLSIKSAIIKMLEQHNYYVVIGSIGKLNRLKKSQLNDLYNLIRYNWNDATPNNIKLMFGIELKED